MRPDIAWAAITLALAALAALSALRMAGATNPHSSGSPTCASFFERGRRMARVRSVTRPVQRVVNALFLFAKGFV